MFFKQSASSTLALLAAIIPSAVGQYNPDCAYFVQYTGGYLVTERVDPLLSPGVASNHVHSITGGSGFNANMTFADTQSSTCTTAQVTQDKSAYWMPALYFQNAGKYYKVPEANQRKIYYKYGNHDCSYDTERSEFPEGFRMITGSALQRVENDTLMGSAGSQMNWQCHDGASNPKAVGFPKDFQSCNSQYVGGLAASMRFPSCWNGEDFNLKDPLAHMAFPTNADGLAGCPAPHNKARFPEIFVEYYLNTKSFDNYKKDYNDPNNPPWVLADGDPTGFSFHMDFFNGWKPGSLLKAMKTCAIADAGSDGSKKTGLASDACFGIAGPGVDGYQTSDVMDKCTIDSIVTPTEDIGLSGNALNALPACNPIQSTQPATIHDPSSCGAATGVSGGSNPAPAAPATSPSSSAAAAAGGNAPSSSANAGASTPTSAASQPSTSMPAASSPSSSSTSPNPFSIPVTSSSSTSTFTYMGCYTDLTPTRNDRTLPNWGTGNTNALCANSCFAAGYSIAGTEFGSQCFCGNELGKGGSKVGDGECDSKCGDGGNCGGSSRLSVWGKEGGMSKRGERHLHRHVKRARGVGF